jgi:hypothetical protein
MYNKLLALFALFSASPVLFSIGINHSIILLLTFLLFLHKEASNIYLTFKTPSISAIIMFLCFTILSIVWNDFIFLFACLHLFFWFLILNKMAISDYREILTHATKTLEILAGLSIIAHFLYLLDFKPLFSITNPNSLPNYYYYTTFSNDITERYMRPSGIYDEPGTFSFILCVVASCREMMGMNKFKTTRLLILGISTLSLAHFIFLSFYLLSIIKVQTFKKGKFIFLFILVAIFLSSTDYINDTIFSRFETSDERLFAGDNRSQSIFQALSVISDNNFSIFNGMGSSNNSTLDTEYLQGMVGQNPLSLLIFYGLIGSWPYYLLLIYMAAYPLIKGRIFLHLFGVMLLLLQRPYIYAPCYSFFISILFLSSLRTFNYHKIYKHAKLLNRH